MKNARGAPQDFSNPQLVILFVCHVEQEELQWLLELRMRLNAVSHQWRIQDFPEVWGVNYPGGRQHTILPTFAESCGKLKEFGRRGGGGPSFPLDPQTVMLFQHQ